jgi:hypothetical protein
MAAPHKQPLTKVEAIETLRRYLPPEVLAQVLAALESEHHERIEQRLDELTVSIALLRETTDTAIKYLAAHVSHLASPFKINHEKESEG